MHSKSPNAPSLEPTESRFIPCHIERDTQSAYVVWWWLTTTKSVKFLSVPEIYHFVTTCSGHWLSPSTGGLPTTITASVTTIRLHTGTYWIYEDSAASIVGAGTIHQCRRCTGVFGVMALLSWYVLLCRILTGTFSSLQHGGHQLLV